jgi:hypothetical protein
MKCYLLEINLQFFCQDVIDDQKEREDYRNSFQRTHKEIIEISEEIMIHYVGNLLQVQNGEAKTFRIMFQIVYNSLTNKQIKKSVPF